FLFDEPLSNLDAQLRVQMRGEIRELQQELGVTTIYVTHDQTEAMTLGHRIAVMREGRVQQIATPREVYELPANLFVAGFIGSPGMNLLPGRSSGDRLELPIGTLTVPEDWPLADRHPRVIAGLRPEHLTLADDSGNPANTLGFEAEVELVEWLGAESFVHLRIASPLPGQGGFTTTAWPDGAEPAPDGLLRLIARVDARGRGFEAERVRCTVDVRSLCLFDPESGDRIWPTPPVARDLHLQLGGRG
ncbi:MAG: TOBE domain-containing protein, partial [Gammaproteobacteria bacterium]|nr:TOBE domain-containing protein [Gammaproteobacteria bacterium]